MPEKSDRLLPFRDDLETVDGVGTYLWSPAEDRLLWSPGLLRLYGRSHAPDGETGFMDFLHPDDRVRVEAETSNYLSSNASTYSHSFRIVRPDGSVRLVLDRGTIERNAAGSARVLRGLNVDITDAAAGRATAGETALVAALSPGATRSLAISLIESENRLRLALAHSPITVFEQDADLRYVWMVNAKLGFDDASPIGKTDFDMLEPVAATALTAFKRKVLETGIPARDEVTVAAPGGSVEYYDLYVHPRHDSTGRTVGLTCVATDITEKKRAETAQRAAHDMFRQLIDQSPFGVYVIDADFKLTHVSQGAQKVFENVRPLIGRDFAEVLRVVWPEPFATEAIGLFRHTLETGESYHAPKTVETRADTAETEAYDWKIERILLPDGRPGAVCHFYDLSERQRHESHIQFIMQEVNHRSKNMLGLVQSIARQTVLSDPEDFRDRFSRRIQSLAEAQDLIVKHGWRSVPLSELVVSQLGHFSDLIGTRIKLTGPELQMTSTSAEAFGMALHELATNAAKYGALSTDEGRIDIAWSLIEDDEQPIFAMSWEEREGPAVRKPQTSGFGTKVTTKALQMSISGTVSVDYALTGIVWACRCPARAVVRREK